MPAIIRGDCGFHGVSTVIGSRRRLFGIVLGQLPGFCISEDFFVILIGFTRGGLIDRHAESEAFAKFVKQIPIKVSDHEQLARNLSGGNQQKVVLAKWLQKNAEVILFDEPTRGIDVGAKYEIYVLINKLASQGKAILMISSELPEVLGMADRILVMHEGRVTGEIEDVSNATQEQILTLAVG